MTMREPAVFGVYRAALTVLEPLAVGLLHLRRRRGKEDPARMAERRGYPSRVRPQQGHVVWLHGASIGETLALMPIVERLTQRGLMVIVTSGTRTSAEVIARRLPPGAAHQFVPLDVPRWVRRFLDHWRPDLVLVAESEIWPNTIMEIGRRRIPLVMVNGRLSERSFRRWQRAPNIIGALFERFSLCLAQSQGDAERIARLGAPRVAVAGNLKFDAPAPPADPKPLGVLQGLTAGRHVFVAASTHPGEEELILQAHAAARSRCRHLLTVVAPRHPHRGAEIKEIATGMGLASARRSLGAWPEPDTGIYIADTVGELGLFYRLAPLVYVGGSLVPHGGQNPIEPAKLGSALLHGPHVHNFADIYAAFDRAGAALPVADGEALARVLPELLNDAGLLRQMARAGTETVEGLGGAVERTLRSIDPFLVQMKLEAQ